MKKTLLSGCFLFGTGIIFKFMHWPMSSLILILGAITILAHGIVFLFRFGKTDPLNSFFYVTAGWWSTYIMYRLLFWPSSKIIFFMAFAMTITWLFLHFKTKSAFRIPQWILLLTFVFSVYLSFVHAYRIYYLFNLNPITSNEYSTENPAIWDKYSWFLYIGGKHEEALKANELAMKLMGEASYVPDLEKSTIEEHRNLIETKKWLNYDAK